MIDASRSMAEPAKFDMARRIAAALCYIGLVASRQAHHPALRTRRSARSRAAGAARDASSGVFAAARTAGGRRARPTCASRSRSSRRARGQRGLTVIISDFLDPGGFEAGLKILRHARPRRVRRARDRRSRDRDPGTLGDVRFVDAETGELRDIDVTPRLASAYVQAWEAHAAELEHFCGRYGIGYVRADAERPFEEIILRRSARGGSSRDVRRHGGMAGLAAAGGGDGARRRGSS